MSDPFLAEGTKIVELASKAGITLRMLGAAAIRIHSPKYAQALDKMDRKLSDLDFMGLRRDEQRLIDFFLENSYAFDKATRYVAMMSRSRYIFENPVTKMHVDVFLDRLEMCHNIDFTKRLSVDIPTISIGDLLLEKMQIFKLNEKDIKDTLVLLREHEINNHDMEAVNSDYVSKLLAKDWGFYYTVTENLKKVKDAISRYDAFDKEDHKDISAKVDKLLGAIEQEPKSLGWKMRAKIGTKQRWYNEVEDVTR